MSLANISFSEWRKRIEYPGALLGLICAVVTVSLLTADRWTVADVGARQMEDRLALLEQVMPRSLYDNNPLQDALPVSDAAMGSKPVVVYRARKNGELTAVAFQTTAPGYGGAITLVMAVDSHGELLGVRVVAHKETPGLADRIEVSKGNWILQFAGMSFANTPLAQWAVKKDGGKIDQFTGATITPRAIVKSVRDGLHFHARHLAEFQAPVAAGQNGRSP